MKRRKTLYAPQIDVILENLHHGKDLANRNIYLKLKEIYSVFSCVKASNDDDLRHIWLEVERGRIEDFGSYKEFRKSGEVETPEEFEELWNSNYPEETKWYKFQSSKFRDELYFFFDDKLIFTLNTKEETEEKDNYNLEIYERFLDWLTGKITDSINLLKEDPYSFNGYIRQNLPWTKRYGRIRRKDFNNIMGESTFRPDLGLGKDLTNKLIQLEKEMKSRETPLLPEMTANEFFRLCEICYDANDYFKDETEKLSPCEKYTRMADGRDDGLRKIDGDSPRAFMDWYYHGRSIGHPWEICRGGNSTHISLYISEKDGRWAIRLAGSSIVRVEETVRMAVALFENKIPFELNEVEEIVGMITGNDYIGIVPDTVFPRYCHSLFPKEDRIIDFMNLGIDREITRKVANKTYWYPLEEIDVG
jgi:hypothetical protein